MLRTLAISGCLVAFAPALAGAAGAASTVTMLPREGGVGLGRKLQMFVRVVPPEKCVITWHVTDPSIATVDEKGVVTGRALGRTKISVRTEGACQTASPLETTILVGVPVATVRVVEAISVLRQCVVSVTATPVDASGNTLADRPVRWNLRVRPDPFASLVPIPVTDDRSFLGRTTRVRGHSIGSSSLLARSEGVTAITSVSVLLDAPYSAEVLPRRMELDVQETSRALLVERNAGGCILGDTRATWKSRFASVATARSVGPLMGETLMGEIRGLRTGSTEVVATTERGSQANLEVEVPAVQSVMLSSYDIHVPSTTKGADIVALPLSSRNRGLMHRSIEWSLVPPMEIYKDVFDLSPLNGYWTTVTANYCVAGAAMVTATCEGVPSPPAKVSTCSVFTGTEGTAIVGGVPDGGVP
jgi:hypothetical protein